MAFDLEGHDLLTPLFVALGDKPKESHVALAADLLRFSDFEAKILGSAQEAKALRALALQVNFQVEAGAEIDFLVMEEVDDYQRKYRDVTISPRAELLAGQVISAITSGEKSFLGDFQILVSRR